MISSIPEKYVKEYKEMLQNINEEIKPYDLNLAIERLKLLKKKSDRYQLAKKIYASWKILPEEQTQPNEYTRKILDERSISYLMNTIQFLGIPPPTPSAISSAQLQSQTSSQTKVAPKNFSNIGLKLDNYLDNVEAFYKLQPFFYDKTGIYWVWNKEDSRYEKTDEIDIMNMIDYELGLLGQTVTSGIKNNYLESFKRVGRKHIPSEMPKTWVQFKNKIIDIKTLEEREANPEYFTTNPIPWKIGSTEETPIIDKLFTDWQGTNKRILYEVISYCLLCDYPIHTIIAMIGSGRNGKTQYQKIIEKFIGRENMTSTELDILIKERFESAKMYKKLVCSMGETNFGVIERTSLLKKLCGGDLIGYEFKNKNPFTDVNYAKIIINTNSLPPSNDTTEGFYRRWLIIHWENNFEESGKDIVDIIPDEEYEALAFKCVNTLRELLSTGRFCNQGSIEDRKNKYILASNPIGLFISERCEQGDSFYVKAKDLYHEYLKYLQERKRRIIKRKEFNQILAEEGFQAEHTEKKIMKDGVLDWEKSYWFEGLKLKIINKDDFYNKKENSPFSPFSPLFHTPEHYTGNKVGNQGEKGEFGENLGNDLWNDFMCILLEKPANEMKVSDVIKLGFSYDLICEWKMKGLLVENRLDYIKLL